MASLENERDEKRLAAVASVKRLKILSIIVGDHERGSISPVEIARKLDVSLANVGYHVRRLAECEVIRLDTTRPVRGSLQHFYVPDPEFMELPWVPALLASFSTDEG